MSQPFNCEDKDLLVAYLYDEADQPDRECVEAHLQTCAACRAEVEELRAVRTSLADWAPSARALGFRVVQTDPAEAPQKTRWWWPLPAWAQAAAAVLVLGVAAGLANLDVTIGTDGVSIRTGWQQASRSVVPASSPAPLSATAQPWRADLAALERRLRTDFTAQPAALAGRGGTQAAVAGDDRILAQVRAIVTDSEQRQQRELALRVAQLQRDLDGQRASDLRRIQDNLGQLGGWTGAEVARQRDMLNYLLRVNSQQIK